MTIRSVLKIITDQ